MNQNKPHALDTCIDLYKYLSGADQFTYEAEVLLHKRKTRCELAELCDLHGSDKGGLGNTTAAYPQRPHTYTDFYSRLFDHCKSHIRYVVEIGIGSGNPDIIHNMGPNAKPGASLRVWRDYFPNAVVYGGDIDPEVLFSEARIRTHFIDQSCPTAIARFWDKTTLEDDMVDLMIDDGWHTFNAGKTLFENSFSKIHTGGLYIIEDIQPEDYKKYLDYFSNTNYSYEFINFHRILGGLEWNRIIVIRKT